MIQKNLGFRVQMGQVLMALLGSRKVWLAISAMAGNVLAILCANPDKWTHLVTSICALAIAVIGGIAYEDGKKSDQEGK